MSDFNLPITYAEICFIETNFSFEISNCPKEGAKDLQRYLLWLCKTELNNEIELIKKPGRP